MPFELDLRPDAVADVQALFEYLAEHAFYVTERVLRSTERLANFPRLYQADPRYGEGVRRISVAGQNVLYEVDDHRQIVKVLAVVGQRQIPKPVD